MLLEDLYSTYRNNPRHSQTHGNPSQLFTTLHRSLPTHSSPRTPPRSTTLARTPFPAPPANLSPSPTHRTSTTAPSTPTRPRSSPRRTAAPATASPSRSTASWASCRPLWRRTPTRRRRCRFLSARRCISLWRLWPGAFLLSRWGVGVVRLSERGGETESGWCVGGGMEEEEGRGGDGRCSVEAV